MKNTKFSFLFIRFYKILRLFISTLLLISVINFINIKKKKVIPYLLSLVMHMVLNKEQVLIFEEFK